MLVLNLYFWCNYCLKDFLKTECVLSELFEDSLLSASREYYL